MRTLRTNVLIEEIDEAAGGGEKSDVATEHRVRSTSLKVIKETRKKGRGR